MPRPERDGKGKSQGLLVNENRGLPRVGFSVINATMSHVVIEPAIEEDLDELSDLLGKLFSEESDFRPNN